MSFIEFFVLDQPNNIGNIQLAIDDDQYNNDNDDKITVDCNEEIVETCLKNDVDDDDDDDKIIENKNSTTTSTADSYNGLAGVRCNLSQFFVRSMHEIISQKFIKKDLKQTKEFIFRQKHFSPSPSKWCIDRDGQIEKVSQWIRSMPKVLPNENGIVMEKKVKFHEKITIEPKVSKIKKSLSQMAMSTTTINDDQYVDDGDPPIQLDETVYEILEKIFQATIENAVTTIVNDGHHSDCSSSSSSSSDSTSSISAPTSQVIQTTTTIDAKKQPLSSIQENSNKLMKKIIKVCKHPGKHVACIQDIKKSLTLFSELIRGHHHFSCSSCRERNINCQCLDIQQQQQQQSDDDCDEHGNNDNATNGRKILQRKSKFSNKYHHGYYPHHNHHHQYYYYNGMAQMNTYHHHHHHHQYYYYQQQQQRNNFKNHLRRTKSYFSFNINEFSVTSSNNNNDCNENQIDCNKQQNDHGKKRIWPYI
ncbi:hypothetical protein DERF_004422 [Dermatophagoides farinae]|uniref:Uncharacterized protein n=1 Tax=Dermatophagoides farinae TaxID=6954 RepID=A0A922I3R1_DERFA|nr:hypothetical protein DERF_004422 [Dermatophagoides farinae]